MESARLWREGKVCVPGTSGIRGVTPKTVKGLSSVMETEINFKRINPTTPETRVSRKAFLYPESLKNKASRQAAKTKKIKYSAPKIIRESIR